MELDGSGNRGRMGRKGKKGKKEREVDGADNVFLSNTSTSLAKARE